MKVMPINTDDWAKDIQSKFYEDYPIFTRYPVDISFVEKNLDKGTAFGKLSVGKNFVVPIIIHGGKLHDFDVAIVGGKTVPMTQESLAEMISNPSAFTLADRPSISTNELNELFTPPLEIPEGRYKGAEFIETVLPTATEEALLKIASVFDENDIAEFIKKGTQDTVLNVLKHSPSEPDIEKLASETVDRDRQYVHKLARNSYSLYQGNSVVDDTQVINITDDEVIKFANIIAPTTETKLPSEASLSLKIADLEVGQEGLISDGHGYIELKVTNDLSLNGDRRIECLHNLNKVAVVVTNVKNIEKVGEDCYLIPHDFKFYNVNYKQAEKVASQDFSNVVMRDENDRYYFKGNVFEKYAENEHDIENLTEEQAAWTAISCGCSEEDFNSFTKMAKRARFSFPTSTLDCPVPLSEVVSTMEKNAEVHMDRVKDILDKEIPVVIKAASYMESTDDVNGVLSLGLLNSRNIEYYVDNVPLFNEVANRLAHLLLVTRIGMKLDEDAIKDAMRSLTKVSLQLRNLKQAKLTGETA